MSWDGMEQKWKGRMWDAGLVEGTGEKLDYAPERCLLLLLREGLCWALLSVCGSSSFGAWPSLDAAWARVSHGMWGLSSPARAGTLSPASEGGFLTTAPPGKSSLVTV